MSGSSSCWNEVGHLAPAKESIRINLYDSPVHLIINRDQLHNLIRGVTMDDTIRIMTRDPSQATLFGDVPDVAGGTAEMTVSGKAIRFNLSSGRTLYAPKFRTLDVLNGKEQTCGVSEMVR